MSFTDPHLKTKAALHGDGAGAAKQTVQYGAQDDPAGFTASIGDDPAGTTRPAGQGNAGGGVGNGAKGSGVARAQSLFSASNPTGTNSAGPEGKSAVDGTSPEIRSTKAPNVTHGNKDIGTSSGMLFPGIVE